MADQDVKTGRDRVHALTIEVNLPDDLRERFEARVREHGGDQGQYFRNLLERDLRVETPHPGMTFREIFAPSQEGFAATGMTDEELSDFVEAEVKAYRAERRARGQHHE
jgi:hypothetical protein